jgi:phosphoribosylformylglycinamidine synthase subunit PurL
LPLEFVLFGEDASRIIVSCDPSNLSRIKEVAVKYRLPAELIGETVPEVMEIKLDGKLVVSSPISALRNEYEGALEKALRTEPELVAR